MYAIIETGGKQYKVSVNDYIKVEKLEANVGDIVNFNVLLLADESLLKSGNPIVEGAVVKAQVVEHGKSKKLVVFKYKPKKRVRTKQGHRQPFTTLKISEINYDKN